mgnify:CR=1 FL=1|tara:strand:+ start:1519 stop:2202 length:684 start_codon:yes stop_codon:yes gene_type:complete
MALYPIPFDELPSSYSFGVIILDIQIDHNTRSYSFVYDASYRIGHVIRDEDPISAYIGSYNDVGFRSTISPHDEQWDVDVLLGETMTYDTYCQQNSVLRNPTSLTVLLDTKYDTRPVWSRVSATTNNTNFLISNGSVENVSHGDYKTVISGSSVDHEYLANHYRVELRVTGTYQYPSGSGGEGTGSIPVYLMPTEDDGFLLSDPGVTEAEASLWGYTVSDGKAFIFY